MYRLKVTLRGSKPPIWRRFLVPADITLERLHDVLQMVMGWTDSHMHQFEARGVYYGTSAGDFDVRRVSEKKTTLDRVLRRPKDRMTYEYDFGDGWLHDVVLEESLPPGQGGPFFLVEAGKRACPPEDIGGIYGYFGFLEVLADPNHPNHREMIDWVGDPFDPEAFGVDEVNRAIHASFGTSR